MPVKTVVQPETATVSIPIPLPWRNTIDRLAAEAGTNRANIARRMIANALREHMAGDELIYETHSGNGRAGGAWTLPDGLEDAVVALYEQGHGVYATAEICNIGTTRTWNALHRSGVQIRSARKAGAQMIPPNRVVMLLQTTLNVTALSELLELPVEVIETLIAQHQPTDA